AQNKEAEQNRTRGPFGGAPISLAIGGAGAPAGGGTGTRRPGGGLAGGGGDAFWRSLDKNGNSRLGREGLAGNGWAKQAVRQAGFDPDKGVGLQEFLDARARSAGSGGARGFRGWGGGNPGGGFGPGGGFFGGGTGFGNPTAGFGSGDSGDVGAG